MIWRPTNQKSRKETVILLWDVKNLCQYIIFKCDHNNARCITIGEDNKYKVLRGMNQNNFPFCVLVPTKSIFEYKNCGIVCIFQVRLWYFLGDTPENDQSSEGGSRMWCSRWKWEYDVLSLENGIISRNKLNRWWYYSVTREVFWYFYDSGLQSYREWILGCKQKWRLLTNLVEGLHNTEELGVWSLNTTRIK